MPDQTRYADLEALKIFKEEYDIKIDEKLNEKINISQGSENAGKILTIDDSGNIIPGNPEVQKATHSSTADTATNAENAVNAEHATSADTATSAESAIKAEQDGNGNVIADTYETKEDAQVKYDTIVEAKADWNQNDENAIDYVKNRPFYTTDPQPVEIASGTYEFTNSSNSGDTAFSENTLLGADFNTEDFYVGKEITVVYDGNTYNLTLGEIIVNYNGTSMSYGLYAGNISILSEYFNTTIGISLGNEIVDTGEPFILNVMFNDGSIIVKDNAPTHDISISINKPVDITIPQKYLGFPVWAGEGRNSIVIGDENGVASGEYAVCEGVSNEATGNSSHAEGNVTTASGESSHSEGYASDATGNRSHAEGSICVASGFASHAEGHHTISAGYGSHSEGSSTYALDGHAEGSWTAAVGSDSHAEGLGSGSDKTKFYITVSWNDPSDTILTVNSDLDASYKHLLLYSNILQNIIVDCTVADNKITTITLNNIVGRSASSNSSQQVTFRSVASGQASHVEGLRTLALGDYQHVQGKYNALDEENKYAHIVGNGTSDTARLNAHTLDWQGNAEFQGDVKANACGGKNPISLVELAEKVNSGTGSAQPDWNVNDENDPAYVKNRTHYDYIETKEVTLTYDGVFEGREYIEYIPTEGATSTYYVKISNEVPTDVSAFVNSTWVDNGGNSNVVTQDDVNSHNINNTVYRIGLFLVVFNDSYVDEIGKNFSKGIYSMHMALGDTLYGKQLTYTGDFEVSKKIDDRFQHQSDWNVNDESSAAFIKNRPFYEETSLQHFDLTDNFTFESQTSDGITAQNGEGTFILPFSFVVGETYKFIINGTEYETTCRDMTDTFGEGYLGFGDIDAVLNNDIASVNFFAYGGYNLDIPDEFYMMVAIVTESEITEFAIDAIALNVVKIDKKYLPDIVFDKINTAQTTADNAQTTADNAQITADNAIGKAETNASNLSTEITNREAADNLKMDKENPVGTGSFSMNRAADSIIGDYSRTNGYNTAAQGVYSSTDGLGTIASARSVCVSGEYNVEDISYSATKFTISSSTYGFEKQSTFYYSSEYNFDEKTGIYVLVSPSTVLDSELANNIKNYVDKIFIVDNSKRMLIPNAISGQSVIKIRSGAGSIYNATTYYSFRGVNVSYAEPSTDVRGKYAHIIGNGTADDARSNAHTLDWDGNAWYQGSVEATAMILLSPNGTRFSITVGDDGVLKSDEIVE